MARRDPVNDLIQIFTDRNIRAELVTTKYDVMGVDSFEVRGVNIFRNQGDRYPATTVWEPSRGQDWHWGDNYEHSYPDDGGTAFLANAVQNSLGIPSVFYLEREPQTPLTLPHEHSPTEEAPEVCRLCGRYKDNEIHDEEVTDGVPG